MDGREIFIKYAGAELERPARDSHELLRSARHGRCSSAQVDHGVAWADGSRQFPRRRPAAPVYTLLGKKDSGHGRIFRRLKPADGCDIAFRHSGGHRMRQLAGVPAWAKNISNHQPSKMN